MATSQARNPFEVSGAAQDQSGESFLESVDAEVRRGFVRKVFGILTFQLAITAGVGAIIYQAVERDAKWVHQWGPALMTISLILSIVVLCAMSCFTKIVRTFPYNYCALLAFTLCESVLVGFISAQYEARSVFLAATTTVALTTGLTAYACLTKRDFTGCGPFLFCALLGLIVVSTLFAIFGVARNGAFAACGAVLFCMYIVYDVQMIVGGKNRKHQLGVDEYVFAALEIYLDVINLFLYLLELFGDRRS